MEEIGINQRKRKTYVGCNVPKQTAIKENRHWKHGVVEIISPTQEGLKRGGSLVKHIVIVAAVDNEHEGVR